MRTKPGEVMKWVEAHLGHDGDDCLIWPFASSPNGYGHMTVNQKHWSSHRYICFRVNGLPPSQTHQAAHSCNNGHLGCVNPRHLRWATPKENCADTQATNNHDRGENNPSAKLTEDDVVSIRYLCANGVRQRKVSRMFGVAPETVFGIYRSGRWPHVTRNHTVTQAV